MGLDPRRVDRINDAMDDALLGHENCFGYRKLKHIW